MSKAIKLKDLIIRRILSQKVSMNIVRKLTGLTYKKMYDWDIKNYLNAARETRRSWRKFSTKDVFGLQIFSKLASLKIPASQLKWVNEQADIEKLTKEALQSFFDGTDAYFASDLKTYACVATKENTEKLLPKSDRNREVGSAYAPDEKGVAILIDLTTLIKYLLIALASKSESLELALIDFLTSNEQKQHSLAPKLLELIKSNKYDEIELKRKKDKTKITGKRYVQKKVTEEIAKLKNSGKKTKIKTHLDENGKITSAEIEEDLS